MCCGKAANYIHTGERVYFVSQLTLAKYPRLCYPMFHP
jgi:hypothetical protein